jgi:hypothetical protein
VAIEKYKNSPASNLLLPKAHSFSRAGLCGNTGTLVVTVPSCRSTTKIIPTSSLKKSITAKDSRASFHRPKFGFCSIAWSRLASRPPPWVRSWGTFAPKISFWMRKGTSKFPIPSLGLYRLLTSKSRLTRQRPISHLKISSKSKKEKILRVPQNYPRPFQLDYQLWVLAISPNMKISTTSKLMP